MDAQPDRLDKVALCVSSCMVAKEAAVDFFGIGEDLPYTLFGWVGDRLAAVAQLQPAFMRLEHEERLRKLVFAATVLRRGWHVDAFTFMAEGYFSADPERTRDVPLHEAFAEPDSAVGECLTFTHVDVEGVGLVLAPYRQVLGRKVEWGSVGEQDDLGAFRDSLYPKLLLEVLEFEVEELPAEREVFYGTLIAGMFKEGFDIQIM